MGNITDQVTELLQRQIERQEDDPLNDARKEAVGHVLSRILDADGFTITVISSKDGKTEGTGISGGYLSKFETLEEMARMLESIAYDFGYKVKAKERGSSPKDRAKASKHILQ